MDKQEQPIPAEKSTYAPSWYDKFAARVNRLPGPSWLAYFFMVLLLLGLGMLMQILEDSAQPIKFEPIALLTYFQIAYVLSLMDFLNKQADKAVGTMKPILKKEKNLFQYLKTRLITMPARPIMIQTIIVLVFFTLLSTQTISPSTKEAETEMSTAMGIFINTPFGIYSYLVFVILWLVNSLFIYHTFHQLITINTTFTQFTEVNLFNQRELYAFSKVSAATGIGLVLSSPVWLIVDPGPISLGVNFTFAVLALIIFITPLIGVRNLLKNQKDAFLENSLKKKENLIIDLFTKIENKDLSDIENYERALSSLEKAHNEIEKTSTWPWKTETLRQVIGALILPVSIWMIQFYLNQLLTN